LMMGEFIPHAEHGGFLHPYPKVNCLLLKASRQSGREGTNRMPRLFEAREIVAIAIEIEENGEEFYMRIANVMKNRQVKETFEFLAGEERKHRNSFREIQQRLGEFKPIYESYPDEYLNYVKALVEENIFTKERAGQLLANKLKTPTAALDTAIGLEKDSILFYNEMKNFVSESEHKPIDEIIQQEKEHLRKLSEIKRTQ